MRVGGTVVGLHNGGFLRAQEQLLSELNVIEWATLLRPQGALSRSTL
jgi:hypothetical protein